MYLELSVWRNWRNLFNGKPLVNLFHHAIELRAETIYFIMNVVMVTMVASSMQSCEVEKRRDGCYVFYPIINACSGTAEIRFYYFLKILQTSLCFLPKYYKFYRFRQKTASREFQICFEPFYIWNRSKTRYFFALRAKSKGVFILTKIITFFPPKFSKSTGGISGGGLYFISVALINSVVTVNIITTAVFFTHFG